MKTKPKPFAARLKSWRQTAGLTQVQLSERLGTSQGLIADWEAGRREPRLTLAQLRHLAEALGVAPADLIG